MIPHAGGEDRYLLLVDHDDNEDVQDILSIVTERRFPDVLGIGSDRGAP
jgi:hypothetical protein